MRVPIRMPTSLKIPKNCPSLRAVELETLLLLVRSGRNVVVDVSVVIASRNRGWRSLGNVKSAINRGIQIGGRRIVRHGQSQRKNLLNGNENENTKTFVASMKSELVVESDESRY